MGIRDWAWDKQVKYVVEPGFYEVPNPLLVNLDAWKKLSQKHRELLGAAAAEAEKKVVAHFAGLAREERPILLQEGIQVIDLPPAEKQKLLRVGSEEGWKAVLERSPQTGAELRKLLTRK